MESVGIDEIIGSDEICKRFDYVFQPFFLLLNANGIGRGPWRLDVRTRLD